MKAFSPEIRAAFFLSLLIFFLALEGLRPLRKQTQNKTERFAANLALGFSSAIMIRRFFFPLVMGVAFYTGLRRWGILGFLPASLYGVKVFLGVLALDYTIYLWHIANHRIGFLWRFHNVHHVDLDMDVSTASRFHFGELILSSFYRALQVILIGVDPFTLVLFETAVTSAAQFHHANFRLPESFEKKLNRWIVTPRMHGVHHSLVREETDSNFSTIFSFWDRLHGTLRLGISEDEIIIGVPAYRSPQEASFFKSLILPLDRLRPWKLPDGTEPVREHRK